MPLPLWLIALMAILWGSSKSVPTVRALKRCKDWRKPAHLDRLIAEARGEIKSGADPEFSRIVLQELAEDCAEIRAYLRQHPGLQREAGAAGMAEKGKHRRESALPQGTRHTTYLAETRQRRAEDEQDRFVSPHVEAPEDPVPDVEIVEISEQEKMRQQAELAELVSRNRKR